MTFSFFRAFTLNNFLRYFLSEKKPKKEKPKKKKPTKKKSKAKNNSDDEALEDSDDLDEGKEVDYMTSSDR